MGSYGYHGDDGLKFDPQQPEGAPYGPTFGNGDVVGCGWNRSKKFVFYTLNGKSLGVAHENVGGRLLPVIGLGGHEASVTLNFGQSPFLFDISSNEEFQTYSKSNAIPQLGSFFGNFLNILKFLF